MQAAANQVRWVPIGEIAEPWEESAEGEPTARWYCPSARMGAIRW